MALSSDALRLCLCQVCQDAGVTFLPGDVTDIQMGVQGTNTPSQLTTASGQQLKARMVILAAGLFYNTNFFGCSQRLINGSCQNLDLGKV